MGYKLDTREGQWLRDKLDTDATYGAGVMRWRSNGAVPPDDVLIFALELGKPVDLARCRAARHIELQELIAAVRARQPAEPSAEERAEARAAFGPGATVVNVLTGRRWTT